MHGVVNDGTNVLIRSNDNWRQYLRSSSNQLIYLSYKQHCTCISTESAVKCRVTSAACSL